MTLKEAVESGHKFRVQSLIPSERPWLGDGVPIGDYGIVSIGDALYSSWEILVCPYHNMVTAELGDDGHVPHCLKCGKPTEEPKILGIAGECIVAGDMVAIGENGLLVRAVCGTTSENIAYKNVLWYSNKEAVQPRKVYQFDGSPIYGQAVPPPIHKYGDVLSGGNKDNPKSWDNDGKCECGAEFCNTTHSIWCKKYGS